MALVYYFGSKKICQTTNFVLQKWYSGLLNVDHRGMPEANQFGCQWPRYWLSGLFLQGMYFFRPRKIFNISTEQLEKQNSKDVA